MKKLLVLLMIAMGFSITACNTVEGAGQDVQAAGRGVENAAEDVEDEID